ncbi:hypothetical protein T484DRAFT_1956103 [Baffinella frigidus]|nr:hypothetical protein T484DRAFT_1956103 [Cryptophyta sp. CCMP2293]
MDSCTECVDSVLKKYVPFPTTSIDGSSAPACPRAVGDGMRACWDATVTVALRAGEAARAQHVSLP